MKEINSLAQADFPSVMEEEGEGGKTCWECVRKRQKRCREELNLSCKEKIIVYKLLTHTEQKMYWYLKNASMGGRKRVLIRNSDFTSAIRSDARSFYYATKRLISRGMIDVAFLPQTGKRRNTPRKVYKFKGVPKDEVERFDFSH